MRRLPLALALACAPATARAGEPAPPPSALHRGAGELSLFADASIASASTLVGVGLRGGYFVRPGLELGAELQTVLLVDMPAGQAQRPGPAPPGAVFRFTPMLRWMPLRTDSFAAYLMAGVGPSALGSRGGALGHVLAAPGVMIHLGGRIWVDVAIRFSAAFPPGRCRTAFPGQAAPALCEFQFGPQLGLAAVF